MISQNRFDRTASLMTTTNIRSPINRKGLGFPPIRIQSLIQSHDNGLLPPKAAERNGVGSMIGGGGRRASASTL